MTNSELRSCKRGYAQHTRWIWAMCFIALVTSRSFATDQPPTNKAWTILRAGLHDEKADKRVQAVSALGLVPHDKKAAETAEDALQDPDANVRRAAIAALGEMNSKASLPKIKALISHSDPKTVMAIAAVLTKFKDPQGYELYCQFLRGQLKGGGSILDGVKDKKAMEKKGVETAIGFAPFGGFGTGAFDYFRDRDSSQSSQYVTAVTALAEDRDADVEKTLVQVSFGGKEPVQLAALRTLAKLGDPTVVKDIEPAMYSEKAVISYTAAATVLHLMDVQAKQGTEQMKLRSSTELR